MPPVPIAALFVMVFRVLLGVLAATYFVVALAILTMRYVLLPQIDEYRPHIERFVSGVLQAPVEVGGIAASWHGLHPELRLTEVRLPRPDGGAALTLPAVDARLSWRSLLTLRPELLRLQLHRPRLEARRAADGTITVAGLVLPGGDREAATESPALQWLLRQHAIEIRDAELSWEDAALGLAPVHLTQVQAALRYGLIEGSRFAFQARGPRELFQRIDIRGEARRTLLGMSGASNAPRWRGRLYVELDGADLGALERHAGRSGAGYTGRVTTRVWAEYRDDVIGKWQGDLAVRDYGQSARDGAPALRLGAAVVSAQGDALAGQAHGKLVLNRGVLSLPDWFEAGDIPVHALSAGWDVAYGVRPLEWRFQRAMLDAGEPGARARMRVDGVWRAAGRTAAGTADMEGRIFHAQAGAVARFMPTEVGPDTRRWLHDGILAGEITRGAWRLRGDLADFPFEDAAPGAADFRVSGAVRGLALDIAPHAEQRWPVFEDIVGTLTVERAALRADVASAAIRAGLPSAIVIGPTRVEIPELHADTVLSVQGRASGAGADVLAYVQTSPLADYTGDVLRHAAITGPLAVPLKVVAPLSDIDALTVAGRVEFANNAVRFTPGSPVFTRVGGALEFTQNGVATEALSGVLLGGSFHVSGRTLTEGGGQVAFQGRADAAALRQFWDVPGMRRIQGAIDYAGTVGVTERGQLVAQVESSLQGVTTDLPAPFAKAAAERWPLRVRWSESQGERAHELRVTLPERADFIAEFAPGADVRAAGQMRAALSVGRDAVLPSSGFRFDIVAPRLDLDDWGAVFDEFVAADEQPGANAVSGLAAAPVEIEVRSDALTIWGTPLSQVHARAQRDGKQVWHASVSSHQAEGEMQWRPSGKAGDRHPAKITARFSRLAIEENPAAADEEETAAVAERPPDIDLSADDFRYDGRSWGRLALSAAADGGGWMLRNLEVDNPAATLRAHGEWRPEHPSGGPRMMLELDWQVRNAGGLLGHFGLPDVVAGGKGRIVGHLAWGGSAYVPDLATLDGHIGLALDDGRFLQAPALAGRLLGVLSLQSLARAATFRPGNLFESGFAWDQIRTELDVTHGVARIGAFRMGGPSAEVELAGTTDLRAETQSLQATVVPRIDASAAALLAGLAVNPVVGLGAFVTQWLLSEPLGQALAYRYRVTGTWAAPEVVRIETGVAAPQHP